MRFYRYHGRVEAARQLVPRIRERVTDLENAVVISVPRGGVVVGAVLAKELGLPHDIVITRKIAAEGDPEWAVGAVTESGSAIWDPELKRGQDPAYLRRAVREQVSEAQRRIKRFRRGRGERDVKGKTVILADDGVARGWTLLAAVRTLKVEGAKRIVIAVPVSSLQGYDALTEVADDVVAGYVPKDFRAVGAYYRRFVQVGDARVKRLLL